MKAVKTNTIHGYEGLKSHEKVTLVFHLLEWGWTTHYIHSFQKFRRELKVWGRLRHSNVVPLLGMVSGFGPLPSAVSPWFCNGDLSYYLAGHRRSRSEKHRLVGLNYDSDGHTFNKLSGSLVILQLVCAIVRTNFIGAIVSYHFP